MSVSFKVISHLHMKFIPLLFILISCSQPTIQEQLFGKWNVKSSKMVSNISKYKWKEEINPSHRLSIIFEKDSIHLFENTKKNTFYYFVKDSTIYIPSDKINGQYHVCEITENQLILTAESNITYVSFEQKEEKMFSKSKIILKKVNHN